MAVATQEALTGPLYGDGTTTVFPFNDFTAQKHADVAVQVDGATVSPSLYSVSLNSTGKGSVTFDTAPEDGAEVFIYLDPDFTQETQFLDGVKWMADPVNKALDRAALRDQVLRRDLLRTFLAPIGSTGGMLPSNAERQGRFLAFNAFGDPIATDGTGSDAALRSDMASDESGKGFGLLGLHLSASAIALGTGQEFVENILGNGTIHGSALGLVNSSVLDQTTKFAEALEYCSLRRMTLDITGLEIRLEKSTNTAPYHYLNGSASYVAKIEANGFCRIVGEGTIGNLTENSWQTILFAEDADYVEIGDGVTMDGFQTVGNRPCSPVQCYGVRHFHLGRAVFRRCGILRLGPSDRDMTEVCTFTEPRFYDCMGTHCIGGKPGGCREWHGNSLYFERCRGGVNFEAEDQDGKNDDGNGNKKWSDAITANVRSVIAVDMFADAAKEDGTLDGSGYATVAVADAEGSVIEIGSIITRRAHAINGRASCLLVGSGQTDQPAAYIHVGSIYAEEVRQIVQYTPSLRGGEIIHIGKVRGKTSPIKLRFDAATTKFVPDQWVTGGTSAATAFVVDVVQENVGTVGDPVYEGTLTLIAVQGNFQNNETLTGSVAGSGTSDGVLRYHAATALHLPFDGGTAAFQVGETVTGPSGSGIVVSFATAGSAPNITGQLRLRAVEGTFNDNDALTGDRGGAATASAALSTGGGIAQIVQASPLGGLGAAPGRGTITFDDVEVDSLGFSNNPSTGVKGFEIENDSAHPGNILDVLKIDRFKCGPTKAQVAVIKDVGEVRFGSNFEYADVIGNRGGTGNDYSLFVSCERFFCDKRWYQGGALNPVIVTASVSGSIIGLQIAGNDNGVGLVLAGAGDFDLVDCDIDGTADEALSVTSTGAVALRGVKLHGNGFLDSGSKVNVIEGGDVLQGILVGDLPDPTTLQPGTQAVVTDATSPAIGSTVVDGNGTGDTAGLVATATAWRVLWADEA